MSLDRTEVANSDRLTVTWVELTIRLGVLGVFLYWSFLLISPFTTIMAWSTVLTVALYPAYDWMVRFFGGRRRLAAALLTAASLLVVVGPATSLVLGLIGSLRTLSTEFDLSAITLPPPSDAVKKWPLIGEAAYQFWSLAFTNLRAALVQIAPQLKPLGGNLLQIAAGGGAAALKFFTAIVVAGFLFPAAPALVSILKMFSRRVAPGRGEHFLELAGATIRSVSSGVVGVAILQTLLAALGLVVAGVPGASLISIAILILAIVQVGPSVVIIPVIIWSWFSMEHMTAMLFTIYMIPVNLFDNFLRPILMARGLTTPLLVILIGVVGGVISFGITGLFLGPITLSVFWELFMAWIKESDDPEASFPPNSEARP
ncbi:AI-2E family transporter [Rhodoblastus acidophilus]|uniref:AI-2E family transporter n=1 Tax=Candidatus Rhodoblastus alkanivorans TaxID=2954117 RepID=A0ABS9Z6W6_9HYPH|nr:AI-2E family transporter [Candidatus Rhodoblastus alkanivorans]MCI4680120.1 AI-2E family transporter [Candidatus Rhodoblastus alkanivorans]MCI4683374.1 AI-2E family transporter [Candidatus Rhodoblastus alkanivorans]MDI4640684.1 AI-2E family transporter [Rhodoblastus acidophilus]